MDLSKFSKLPTKNEQLLASYFDKFQHIYTFSTERFIRGLRIFSFFCGIILVLIGCTMLIVWYFHARFLQALLPNSPTIMIDPAIAFICTGFSLSLKQIKHKNKGIYFLIRFAREITALIALLLGVFTLIGYSFYQNHTIAQFILQEKTTNKLMSPLSSILLVFISIALLIANTKILQHRISQYLMLLSAIVISPTVIAYVYNMNFIYRLNIQLPLSATIAFFLLIVGIFISEPQEGVTALIVSETAGGFMARRLLFTTIITPLLLGAVILAGERLGLYDTDYRFLLLIISTIVVYTISIWRNARDLHAVDTERRRSVQQVIFLAGVGKVLSSTLEYQSILNSVAQLTVAHMANWCSIDILQPDGTIETLAIAHKNHQKIFWRQKIKRVFPLDVIKTLGISTVLQSGKPEIYSRLQELHERFPSISSREVKILHNIHILSIMIVPLFSHKKTIGTVTLVSTTPSLHYSNADLAIAEELAARTSLAIENARLFEQAQDATKLRDEFISITSHELKTPVTSLKVYAQVLSKKLKSRGEETEIQFIEKVELQLDRLTKLIEDLLNISRLRIGKLKFEQRPFTVGDLVKEIVDAIQPTLEKHTLTLNLLHNPIFVGDRDRIGQIIINLITNAIKYSPQATNVIIIVTETRNLKCIISIQDFGIGIDKKNRSKIFERFYQVNEKDSQTFPGLGIGLYLSQDIARRHGGKIVFQSTKGKGSIFSLVLPLRKNHSE